MAAAKYKDEDQLANKFKGSLYPLLCSAKGLRSKNVLGTALSPSSSLTQAHTPVCTQQAISSIQFSLICEAPCHDGVISGRLTC